MQRSIRWLHCLVALWTGWVGAVDVRPGLYFDPDRDGHGLDLQQVGSVWVVVFYTYDAQGQPEWMLGVASEQPDGRLTGSLDRFDYAADRDPPQQVTATAGAFSLDFASDCKDQGGSFDWDLDGEQGQWCVQPLLVSPDPAVDFTGLWFAGGQDQGWGLTLGYQGGASPAVVQVLFYYDSTGQPRWSLGVADPSSDTVVGDHLTFQGYCRNCQRVPLQTQDAGRIEQRLMLADGWPVGEVDIEVTDTLEPGGQWLRPASPLVPLSDPVRGLIPVPERIDPDRAVVFTDVTVIPLAGDAEQLGEQTVVVENTAIKAMGARGTVPIPEGAIRIDGRGRYLGPGLQDHHTHFTFGGQIPMQEAGLLFIANGVTTVLNMGDGGTLDLPGLDLRFGAGEFIGPAVYAGQAVYAPSDGRSAAFTVSTPSGATAFAQRIADQGYDFIKVYNGIAPEVMSQFLIEGERLGMPVIGHLPKTQTMHQSLAGGQRQLAHVAEVYFTFFGNQPREELLDAAAAELLEFEVYLSDTLTASESFAGLFGGNTDNFEIFSQRNGVQYQPLSFFNSWRSFFQSATLQPPGSQPGQLDARLVFFKQMVRHFHDAGVPLLLGTDSPGHTGVISGFSVHEHLRIYAEIGLTPHQSWLIASRNGGRFFDDTLAPALPFGTVEPGRRADLVLLDDDPLVDVVNLSRPRAVMSRGRLFSRTLLDRELQALDEKYPGPFGQAPASGEVFEHHH